MIERRCQAKVRSRRFRSTLGLFWPLKCAKVGLGPISYWQSGANEQIVQRSYPFAWSDFHPLSAQTFGCSAEIGRCNGRPLKSGNRVVGSPMRIAGINPTIFFVN